MANQDIHVLIVGAGKCFGGEHPAYRAVADQLLLVTGCTGLLLAHGLQKVHDLLAAPYHVFLKSPFLFPFPFFFSELAVPTLSALSLPILWIGATFLDHFDQSTLTAVLGWHRILHL